VRGDDGKSLAIISREGGRKKGFWSVKIGKLKYILQFSQLFVLLRTQI